MRILNSTPCFSTSLSEFVLLRTSALQSLVGVSSRQTSRTHPLSEMQPLPQQHQRLRLHPPLRPLLPRYLQHRCRSQLRRPRCQQFPSRRQRHPALSSRPWGFWARRSWTLCLTSQSALLAAAATTSSASSTRAPSSATSPPSYQCATAQFALPHAARLSNFESFIQSQHRCIAQPLLCQA